MIVAKKCPAPDAGRNLPNQRGMRRHVHPVLLLFALLAFSVFPIGCRARAGRTQTEGGVAVAENATPTPRPGDELIEKKNVSLKDEGFDLAFAHERHETYALQPGSQVRIEGIGGRIEVEKSSSDKAELFVVRSVEDREDIKHRNLVVKTEGNELTIRMERVKRSALFSMFNERGREKQRILLRLPKRVDLSIGGSNGRITVTELDGKLSIDGVSGRVMVGKVSGETELSAIHGPLRFIGDGESKNRVSIDGVFGTLDLLFTGNVNLDMNVDGVFGQIDQGIPNAVYESERRPGDNNFRARFGKGGPLVSVSGVHGRVRIAPATAEDVASIALAKPGPAPEASKASSGTSK